MELQDGGDQEYGQEVIVVELVVLVHMLALLEVEVQTVIQNMEVVEVVEEVEVNQIMEEEDGCLEGEVE